MDIIIFEDLSFVVPEGEGVGKPITDNSIVFYKMEDLRYYLKSSDYNKVDFDELMKKGGYSFGAYHKLRVTKTKIGVWNKFNCEYLGDEYE